jgi:hypothetical protein
MKRKKKFFNNRGQSMLESAFVVVFISLIMLAFVQIIINVTYDLMANETAFVALRSAAVTKTSDRMKEAKSRSTTYFLWYGLLPIPYTSVLDRPFGTSTRDSVASYYKRDGANQRTDYTTDGYLSMGSVDKDKSFKDFSGKKVSAQILQVYYASKTLLGKLTAPTTSSKNLLGGGYTRYQASRAALVPSPDEDYYYKAYPGAKKFD